MGIHIGPYLDTGVEATHEALRTWQGDAQTTALIAAHLQRAVTELAPGAPFLQHFHEVCPFDGAAPDDYQTREIALRSGAKCLVGIRFFGGDTSKPFAELIGASLPLQRLPWPTLRKAALDAMQPFGPAWLRVFSPASAGAPPHPAARSDQRLVVGHLPTLRELIALPADRVVTVEPDPLLSHFEAYQSLYAHDHGGDAERRLWLPVEDRASLEACAREGGLFEIQVDGEWAGLLAARVEQNYGVEGWEIVDEILAPRFRGQGLAPLAQRALFDALDAGHAPLIFGTIDGRNTPSLKTARRAGRLDVGGWWFLPMVKAPAYMLGTPAL